MRLLEVRGITKYFGGILALDKVSFVVNSGEIRGLIGPNGAGKTVLFNIISGFYRPTNGNIKYQDKDITGKKACEIAKRGLVRTFQQTVLFQELTVYENVLASCYLEAKPSLFSAIFRTDLERQKQTNSKAIRVLEFLGLVDRKDQLAKNLPLGSQRCLAIAIALSANPKLLLLDEPFAGMNPEETAQTMEIVCKIHETGITIILVEHDMKAVMGLCDNISVLNFGQILAEGTPKEIGSNKKVIKAYLGS